MRRYCASTLPFSAFALNQFLDELAENHILAVELVRRHFEDLDAETSAALQQRTGVRFRSLLSTDNIATPNGLDEMTAVLDTAVRLSIPMVSVPSGGREEAAADEVAEIVDRLKRLTQAAEDRGLTLSLYAHEGSMAYNLASTQRILDAIPSKSLGFYYSPYHFHRAGDDPVAALEALADRLCNVYFNCGVDAETGREPFWSPEMDFGAICQAIDRTGYAREIMLIYLGLKADTPQPIINGTVKARSLLETHFNRSNA